MGEADRVTVELDDPGVDRRRDVLRGSSPAAACTSVSVGGFRAEATSECLLTRDLEAGEPLPRTGSRRPAGTGSGSPGLRVVPRG